MKSLFVKLGSQFRSIEDVEAFFDESGLKVKVTPHDKNEAKIELTPPVR